MKHLGLCYLATPYTKYRPNIEAAFIDAARLVARMIANGFKVYSPIVHTHPIAIHGGLSPLDHSIWLPYDEAMMDAAYVLVVAQMEGWDESFGIAHEIKYFIDRRKSVYYLDPETLSLGPTPSPLARTENE